MIYFLALLAVLASGLGGGLLVYALALRPERARHAAREVSWVDERGRLRTRVASLFAVALRGRRACASCRDTVRP